jgi:hypothetical protein
VKMRCPRYASPSGGTRIVGILATAAVAMTLAFPPPRHARKTHPVDVTAPREGPAERVYFYSRSQSESELLSLQRALIEHGARSVNCFLPEVVVCELPVGMNAADFARGIDVSVVHESQVDAEDSGVALYEPGWMKRCYAGLEETGPPSREYGSAPALSAPTVESVMPVPVETVWRTVSASDYPEPRNIQQNSELMVGLILANLILPESVPYAGNQEDWTDETIGGAIGQAILGMLYYQNQYDYRKAGIHFVVRSTERVYTTEEPINEPLKATSWITEVMDRLGYPNDGTTDRHLTAVHEYNNDKRNQVGTQWVFTAFIANAQRDPDHLFDQGRDIGWAYLGGPYLVIPHPAGATTTAQAMRHYLGSIFWALEEGLNKPVGCSTFSGYLDVPNLNKVISSEPPPKGDLACGGKRPEFCIMNHIYAFEFGYWDEPCFYTAKMLGVSDENRNSIPDGLDAPPVVHFENSAVETVFTREYTLRFRVASEGVLNQNPWQIPELRVNYAAPVGFVGVSDNGLVTRQLLPLDGVCDELEEDFAVHYDVLPGGESRFSVITRNSIGATSPEQTKKIFFIGLSYMHFGYRNFNQGNLISLNLFGETFDACFDVHRIDVDGDGVDRIIARGRTAGHKIGQFTPFEYFDVTTDSTEVVPGRRYRYRVCGAFSTTYCGHDTTVTMETHEIETRAMIPVPEGGIVSHASPNPFTQNTWLSVVVPTMYEDPRLPVAIAMDVDVSVYDVLGRRVKRLLKDYLVGQVVTLSWDGTNERQEKVSAGVYFVKAVTGVSNGVTKVVVVR